MGVSRKRLRIGVFCLSAFLNMGLWGCNDQGGQILGQDTQTGPAAAIPPGNTSGGGTGTETKTAIGDSCHTTQAGRFCVGLKYVVLTNSAGSPVISQADVLADLNGINNLWDKCGIAFQIDEYLEANPADYGLVASPTSMGDLTNIRSAFVDEITMLVATTVGTWSVSANAWTSMPGGPPYGAVIEGSVATYAPIIAHELGHYMNLDHVSDASDLMNPVIYTTSTNITADQCATAQSALNYFWPKMLR